MTLLLQKGRQINPRFRGGLYYASLFAVVGAVPPFLNVYFMELGLDGRQIGLLGMLAPFFQILYTPVITSIADRWGKRVLMLSLSMAAMACAYLLLGLPRTFPSILAVMALVALLGAPITSLGDGLVARMASRHSIDYGRMRLWGSAGYAIFSIAAGVVWLRTGYRWMFTAAFGLYLLVAFFSLFLEELPSVEKQAAPPWKKIARHPVLFTLLMATFLVGGAMMMSLTFNGVYMRYLGGGEDMIGLQMGLGAVIELPFMFFAQHIMRKIGGLNALLIGYALYGLSFLGASLAIAPWMLLLTTLLRGPGFAMFAVCTVVLFDRYAGDWSVTTQAMMNATAYGIAPLIASPVGGFIYDLLGPSKVFLTCSLLVLVAMIILYSRLVLFRPASMVEEI